MGKTLLAERYLRLSAACSILNLLACPTDTPSDTSAESDPSCTVTGCGGGSGSGGTASGGASAAGGNDPGPTPLGGAAGAEEPGEDPTGPTGELVVTVFDGGTRYAGMQQLVFEGDRVFWTRDQDGTLAIFSASLSGSLPAEPELLMEHPWVPSSGWSQPPLLVTTTHLMLPIVGSIDLGSGPVNTDGWATLRRDGSELQLARLPNWWITAHGAHVVMDRYDGPYDDTIHEVNLTTGSATLVPGFIPGRECAYDPAQDEVGCIWYSQLNSYDFAAQTARAIAASSTIRYETFGTSRITFNATHWFVPDVSGLAAYPRAGGSPRYYSSIDTRNEAYAVDDDSAFVCIAGDLVRVSLADETHEALTHGDCASIQGFGAVVAIDATYVYYLGVPELAFGARPIDILRIARAAPGSPVTPGE